ncbi:hypothetical protein [Roseibacillus ishigakijimensis]|nr:hypothetical protein [Roseibacillus ishigakijimensis]
MSHDWEPHDPDFSKWPDNKGFFRILSPIRENVTVAFRIIEGKVEEDRIYVIDLAFNEIEVFNGGFIQFMEFILLGDKFDIESPFGGLSFLMRDMSRNGNVILQSDWPKKDSFDEIYSSLNEKERGFVDRFKGEKGLGQKYEF